MPTVKITNLALFGYLVDQLFGRGSSGFQSTVLQDLVDMGDVERAFQHLTSNAQSLFLNDQSRKNFIKFLVQMGAVKFVADNAPIQKSVTLGNWTIAI